MRSLPVVLLAAAVSGLHQEGNTASSVAEASSSVKGNEEGKHVLHFVAHTHDDVGWLKTVDDLFKGLRAEIQDSDVESIITTVVQNLEPQWADGAHRKFTYVEMAFFWRWWRGQTTEVREMVKKFVEEGRLQFSNGGWCMHDEAATHYIDMIDQWELGHRFLSDTFKVLPTTGWQIDPFGHSASNAYLQALMGFDGYFFSRADGEDKAKREKEKSLEMLYRSEPSVGAVSDIYTQLQANHYSYPPDFDFDGKPFIQDDPLLFEYNLPEQAQKFASLMEDSFFNRFRSKHIMLTMGNDFNYKNAYHTFRGMDALIKYINSKPDKFSMTAKYSTPADYLSDLSKEALKLPSKGDFSKDLSGERDDFFPYGEHQDAYWTGYFTSRPGIKGLVRSVSALLKSLEKMYLSEALAARAKGTPLPKGARVATESALFSLREALGIAQHHDAVSGTEKQAVNDDYTYRLAEAAQEAHRAAGFFFADRIADLLRANPAPPTPIEPTIELTHCPYANISVCAGTHALSEVGGSVIVAAFNQHEHAKDTILDVPVPAENIRVEDKTPGVSPSVPTAFSVSRNPLVGDEEERAGTWREGQKPYTLTLKLSDLPALSYRLIQLTNMGENAEEKGEEEKEGEEEKMLLETSEYRLEFDKGCDKGSCLKKVTNKKSGLSMEVSHSFAYYKAFEGEGQKSGAYIFKEQPLTEDEKGKEETEGNKIVLTKTQVVKVKAPLNAPCQEAMVFFDAPESLSKDPQAWPAFHAYRICEGIPRIQVRWGVGPLNDDDVGKEVVSLWKTDIESGDLFSTDSNGLQMIERKRFHRPDFSPVWQEEAPSSSNYFPVNSAVFIEEKEKKEKKGANESKPRRLTVVTDRSQGAASLESGQIELMVHRRLRKDDSRGVGEPLEEPGMGLGQEDGSGLRVRGSFFVLLEEPGPKSAFLQRMTEQSVVNSLLVQYSPQKKTETAEASEEAVAVERRLLSTPSFHSSQSGGSFTHLQDLKVSPNLKLLTFAPLLTNFLEERPKSEYQHVLVRLQHLFGKNEALSSGVSEEDIQALEGPADFDLASLFPPSLIGESGLEVVETALSGTVALSEIRRIEWLRETCEAPRVGGLRGSREKAEASEVAENGSSASASAAAKSPANFYRTPPVHEAPRLGSTTVTLKAAEIRTFVVFI
uniref:Alpha-mannosidase n=1 Tax=Chromera velia CCMP2878 TaxID=1169474 RepID=A0A0G4IBA5_9ALVE|eukprot:Cvel_12783.t1-p1 / transcript=Cvel_12783.t1 / gene=Cvel_12783 / organism=Chromera_velia_CCMP2878 / gene_product=Lysosomal alpha-mannosidase, putative / transcript_product=Lysosomal alpha-mannosidase, putative / location=Cvel_scaffold850:56721-62047(-) / protein_length=1161 / sequence_SO=supercontig / SO=protein_coding / is_pseudo=false